MSLKLHKFLTLINDVNDDLNKVFN